MSSLPVCETIGLINLCSPAPLIEAGAKVDVGHAWFILQVPNLIWFLTAFILVILGIFLPFPTREVDTRGCETAGENGRLSARRSGMNVPVSKPAFWDQGAPSDYATREIVHWPGWRNLIGWDIFLNNLTAGIFVVTVLAWWLAPTASTGLIAPALTLAWLVLLADLLVLVADLGDPWRLLHMLRVFKRQSPMSVGTWSLSSFAALLTPVLVAAWLPWPEAHTVAKWLSLLAMPPALGVLVYKGVLFSCTSQPGLRDARWLSAHFAVSGLMLGSAVLILLAGLLGLPVREALRGVMFALLVLAAITLALLHRNVMARLRQRYSLGTRQAIYWIVAVFGLAIPLVLVAIVPGSISLEGAAVLALVGGLVLRQALVRLAEPVN